MIENIKHFNRAPGKGPAWKERGRRNKSLSGPTPIGLLDPQTQRLVNIALYDRSDRNGAETGHSLIPIALIGGGTAIIVLNATACAPPLVAPVQAGYEELTKLPGPTTPTMPNTIQVRPITTTVDMGKPTPAVPPTKKIELPKPSTLVIEMTIRPSPWKEVENIVKRSGWAGIEGEGQALGPNLFVFIPKRADIYGQSIFLVINDKGQVVSPMDISSFEAKKTTDFPVTRLIKSEGKSGNAALSFPDTRYFNNLKEQKLAEMIVGGKLSDNFIVKNSDGKPYIAYTDWSGKIWGALDIKSSTLSFPGDRNFPFAEKGPVLIASLTPLQLLGEFKESNNSISQVSSQNGVDYYLGRTPLPGFGWSGDKLVNSGGATVAVLNKDGDGIVFSDAKAINDMLFRADGKGGYETKDVQLAANTNGRADLVNYLNNNPDLHFFSYSVGDKQPPVAVTLSPDGKSIALVQGFAGTTGYEWHKEAKALAATSEGNQAMYFLDSAGKWQQCIIVKDGAKENAIFGADWGRWIWDKDTVYPDNWQFADEANEILAAMKARNEFNPTTVGQNIPRMSQMADKDISDANYFAWIDGRITDKTFAEKLRAVKDPVLRLMAVNTFANVQITKDKNTWDSKANTVFVTDDDYFGIVSRFAAEITHYHQRRQPLTVWLEVPSWYNGLLLFNGHKQGFDFRMRSLKVLLLLPPYLPY